MTLAYVHTAPDSRKRHSDIAPDDVYHLPSEKLAVEDSSERLVKDPSLHSGIHLNSENVFTALHAM